MRTVVVQLKPEEVLRFMRVMTGQDKGEALAFLKDVVKPQVDDATRGH